MENNNPQILKYKKLFVLDMDGTFYLGNCIYPRSMEFIRAVKDSGKDFLFFTNNSSKTGEDYIKKLAGMGLQIRPDQILTSGDVTIDFLKREYPGKSVFLLATGPVREQFARAGIPLTEQNPDLVVLAFDMELTYARLETACAAIRAGAPFLATHPDINCPTEHGFIPDCGAMIELIVASTGVRPRVLGKPHKETVEAISHLTGCAPEEMVLAGDRLYTEIAMGAENGITTALVLSGETTPEDLQDSPVKPTFVFDGIWDMIGYLK